MKPKVDCHISYAVSGSTPVHSHCVHMDASPPLNSHLRPDVTDAMRRGENTRTKKEKF
jgi:hypothetical protein